MFIIETVFIPVSKPNLKLQTAAPTYPNIKKYFQIVTPRIRGHHGNFHRLLLFAGNSNRVKAHNLRFPIPNQSIRPARNRKDR